jgi:hypothetical protein
MRTQIIAAILFIWTVAAIIGSAHGPHLGGGARVYTELAIISFCAGIGLIGLVMAFGTGKRKVLEPPQDSTD